MLTPRREPSARPTNHAGEYKCLFLRLRRQETNVTVELCSIFLVSVLLEMSVDQAMTSRVSLKHGSALNAQNLILWELLRALLLICYLTVAFTPKIHDGWKMVQIAQKWT